MKRLCITLLIACTLLAIPAVAHAAIDNPTVSVAGYGSTYYSNVPGFNVTIRTYYYPASATQHRVTTQTLSAYLSATRVSLLGASFYNSSGVFGPGSTYLYSSGLKVRSLSLGSRALYPGQSTSYTWYPSQLVNRNASYGGASMTWSQTVKPYPIAGGYSTPKPCVVRTSTF